MPKPGFAVITITDDVYKRLERYHKAELKAKDIEIEEYRKLGYKTDYGFSFSRNVVKLLDEALRKKGF